MRQKRALLTLFSASVLLAAPLLFGFLRSSAAPNNDNLLGYWKFEESLVSDNKVDYSGDNHPGSPSGTVLPPYSTNTPPTIYGNGQSMSFAGNTNNAVNITSTAALDDLSDFSASAWIYPTSYAGESAQGRIIDKTNSVNGWSFYVDNGALHFYANFSSAALNKVTTATLPTNEWAHVGFVWDGTENSSGVKLYINGVEQTSFSTDTSGSGSRVSDSSYNIIIGNNSSLNRGFSGDIDEVRLYDRPLLSSELEDMAGGEHPTAVWTGAVSSDYETAGNWSINSVPDPYAHVRISPAVNQAVTSADIALGGLTIDAGARFNILGHNITMNDGGAFENNGTLQMRNSQTLHNFQNDTDSGTVFITPVGDTVGLKAGNNYHDLIINDSTFVHWPLDETSGTSAGDVSGHDKTAGHIGSPAPSVDRPATNFTNERSLDFDGSYDALEFSDQQIPPNSTWCAWVKIRSGSGVVIGGDIPGQYSLAIFDGTEIRVRNEAADEQASWSVASLYGSWKHLCVAQTDLGFTHTLILYVDGESQGGSETLLSGAGMMNRIGTDSASYFDGLIDDVRVYSRVLTGAEVNAMVAGNMPGTTLHRLSLNAPLEIQNDLVINSGIFDVTTSNHTLSVNGDFINNGGVFRERSGTVVLGGEDQQIKSSTTFYNLTKDAASPAALRFGKGSLTTIRNNLTLLGREDNPLLLRSTEPGTAWFIDPSGNETIDHLDVQDGHNIKPYPIDITDISFTDSGNNLNWTVNVAPNTPINLGGLEYTSGGFVGDNTPTLTFELSDPNLIDAVAFQIQIDNDADFSSPEVDYVSGTGAQGPRSFTVGQGAGEGTYYAGDENESLQTGSYYWRVKAIDNYTETHESSYAVANDGEVAFQLDATPPTDPGVPTTTSLQTSKVPTWTWDASIDNESGLGSPIYTLQWSTDASFESDVSSNTTDNTTFTHGTNLADGTWYFRVRSVDEMGNHSSWVVSAPHLIDTVGPTTPIAPYTSSPTNFNQPTWSWPAPTDAGVGLAAVPYTVQWSKVSNFASGVNESNPSTNSFPHPTTLADGTWYFRVRAVDAIGNLSAWSAVSSVLIDTSPPSLPGQPYTSNPTNDNTPTWTWEPSIDEGVGLTPTPYFIQWSSEPNFSSIGGSTTVATNSFTHSGALPDGTWYFRANARDTLSNQSAYSPVGSVLIDTSPPEVSAAPTTESPTNNTTPTWTWDVPDDVGVGLADVPYEIEWSQDPEFSTVAGSATSGSNSFTHADNLSEGTWYFRMRATDKVGNTSEFSEAGELEIDLTPPTVPGDPSTSDPLSEATPTWTWTVSTDSGSGLADVPYEVQWSADNTFTEEVFDSVSEQNEFTHTDNLEDSTWYFRVRAVDRVGNKSDWSNAGSKVVDNNPPTVPGTPSTTNPTADNTPTWTWDASTDAGLGLDELPYMIEWSQDPDFLVNVQTDTIAENEFTHQEPIADGTWYFRVRAVDNAANMSDYSGVGTVFVDASPPTTPGTPATDTPTTNDTPTWAWSASSDGDGTGFDEEAYIIEWSESSDFSEDVQSATSPTNEFTHADPLPDGIWYFRVKAVDIVGNESEASATASVQVDDTPPSIPDAPFTNTPTNNTTPTWTWTASTDNGVGLRNPAYDIQWSADSGFETGIISGQANTNSFTHGSELPEGIWYFRVRAVDNLNNTSDWSSEGVVQVSTAGPTTPGTPATDSPTTDTTPTWSWDASTADTGLADPGYHIEWSQDPDFLSGVSTLSINTSGFTHADELADGTWYFRLRAEDNTSTFSSYSPVGSVLIDTTAPSVPGSASTQTPTNDTTPTWTWEASTDSGVGLAEQGYYIEWSQDGDFVTGVSNDTSPTTSFTHADELADGTWYFRVRAVDSLDNQSAYSSVSSVLVDATAPSTPGRPDTTAQTSDATPTWTWDASTDSGVGLGNPAYELEWSQSNSFTDASSATTNNTNFTHSTGLTDGTWYFRVRAYDDAGNISNWSAQGEVEIDVVAPTAPGMPTVGTNATNNVKPTWTWDASTDSGVGLGNPAYELEWSQDGGFLDGVSSGTVEGAEFTHGTDLPEGTWYLRVRAVDKVGNKSGWSGHGSVYIDTDAPSAPGTPDTEATPTNNNTPTWTWGESSDDGFGFGDEPYQLQWSRQDDFSEEVTEGISTTTSFTHDTALEDGTWYFRVRARDDAGNTSAWSSPGSVYIDASAPTLPEQLKTDTPTTNTKPTWTWDASTDSGVGLADPAYEIQWSSAGNFSNASTTTTNDPVFTHTNDLSDGTWYFRVRARDGIGNNSAWASSSVTIDNEPPVISNIAVTPGSAGAVITWLTNELSSSRIVYGTGSELTEATSEIDTNPRVVSHRVVLQNLSACTTYQYQVISIDVLDNQRVSGKAAFTTTACSGDAAIMAQNRAVVGSGGGQASLNNGGVGTTVQVPAGAVGEETDFQIKQLSPAAALSTIGQPSGYSLVGSHIYDLKALKPDASITTSFDGRLTITMGYSSAEINGFIPDSLRIFRHGGSSWQPLENCSVNTSLRQVSCQTSAFSVFGLFGTRQRPAAVPPLPEGAGTVEPDPLPETKPLPENKSENEGSTETANDSRGLSGTVTKVIQGTFKRPAWWAAIILLIASAGVLFYLKKYHQVKKPKNPYGIHKDE